MRGVNVARSEVYTRACGDTARRCVLSTDAVYIRCLQHELSASVVESGATDSEARATERGDDPEPTHPTAGEHERWPAPTPTHPRGTCTSGGGGAMASGAPPKIWACSRATRCSVGRLSDHRPGPKGDFKNLRGDSPRYDLTGLPAEVLGPGHRLTDREGEARLWGFLCRALFVCVGSYYY